MGKSGVNPSPSWGQPGGKNFYFIIEKAGAGVINESVVVVVCIVVVIGGALALARCRAMIPICRKQHCGRRLVCLYGPPPLP